MMHRTIPVSVCKKLTEGGHDALVLVFDSSKYLLSGALESISSHVKEHISLYEKYSGTNLISCSAAPNQRLILSCTGKLNREVDDVRRFYEAGQRGISAALRVGAKSPLLALPASFESAQARTGKFGTWSSTETLYLNSLLGGLNALYAPLMKRERLIKSSPDKLNLSVGLLSHDNLSFQCQDIAKQAEALEEGRRVSRDIGATDPQRMAASRIEEYILEEFPQTGDNKSAIKITSTLVTEELFPLAGAVNRQSQNDPLHQGRIIKFEYDPSQDASTKDTPINELVCLVGKGITYDTGGHDIKTGGLMAAMSLDKCGAANVTGFFKLLDVLRPKGKKFVGSIGCVRNSIGGSAYVSDEVITSRSGVRVRITNTDAEGRLVLADLLHDMRELILQQSLPAKLFSFATLTGHAKLSYGDDYSAIIANGPAHQLDLEQVLQLSGEKISDQLEISRLRREDFETMEESNGVSDLLNASKDRSRGHQKAMAFMVRASGLDKHSIDNNKQIPYVHFDIAGTAMKKYPDQMPQPSGLFAMANQFILPNL